MGLRLDAVAASVRRVRCILSWFQSQRQLAFYASSLLFVYEGHPSSSSYVSTTLSPAAAPGMEVAEDRNTRGGGGRHEEEEVEEEAEDELGGGQRRPDTGALKVMSEYNNNNNIRGWTMGYSLAQQYDNQRKAVQHYHHHGGGKDHLDCAHNDATPPPIPTAAPVTAIITALPAAGVELQPNGNGVVLLTQDGADGDVGEMEGGDDGGGAEAGGKGGEVEVRMIDFAHVFPSNGPDHGYIYGLKRLLAVLEEIHGDAS